MPWPFRLPSPGECLTLEGLLALSHVVLSAAEMLGDMAVQSGWREGRGGEWCGS